MLTFEVSYWNDEGDHVELPFRMSNFTTDVECIAKARLWDVGHSHGLALTTPHESEESKC
jgi:hypothetical protein